MRESWQSGRCVAVLCILGLARLAPASNSGYDTKQSPLSTCPRARFPARNYVYRVPADSVWEIVAAKHAAISTDLDHAVIAAYVSDKDPWSPSMRNSTLACLHRFYRERDLVFLTVRYEDMSLNEQMQHRIGNLPAFRIFSQGRRFVADGQQSLQSLMDTIETRTGVAPIGPADMLASEDMQRQLQCKLEVDEVTAEDFVRAGEGPWVTASAASLVFLALWRLGLRLNRRLGPVVLNAGNVPEIATMVNAPAGGQ
ncbi:hypothetical protein CVIRNUC_007329 [Coccomyxa viridis]|uniref:Thioredoxin-like fold domain-containing protein n=1 Tax=Coccomyxa viridis TaxID=1274662 RepID=A0AAV1I9T4_9CHLO|nr:hypothetical protein CVIRNUC_007329 [Coccomyxa viridis]